MWIKSVERWTREGKAGDCPARPDGRTEEEELPIPSTQFGQYTQPQAASGDPDDFFDAEDFEDWPPEEGDRSGSEEDDDGDDDRTGTLSDVDIDRVVERVARADESRRATCQNLLLARVQGLEALMRGYLGPCPCCGGAAYRTTPVSYIAFEGEASSAHAHIHAHAR